MRLILEARAWCLTREKIMKLNVVPYEPFTLESLHVMRMGKCIAFYRWLETSIQVGSNS
jgi:hypothetical protein